MSGFYLGDNTSNGSASSSRRSSTSSAPLPFPEPLPRADFLVPDFDPSAYLSSLGHRHQTLEDLRADLRARSQLLSQELLDLVNSHYNEFISLGDSLKGGEEKVEELRVGLLSLRREVESVRLEVLQKEEKVGALVEERRRVRTDLEQGRQLLEWYEKLGELEASLMLDSLDAEDVTGVPSEQREELPEDSDYSDEEDGDAVFSDEGSVGDEDDASLSTRMAIGRVRRRVDKFQAIQQVAKRIGDGHPLVMGQKTRLIRVRNILLLDIRSAHRQNTNGGQLSPSVLLRLMALYRDLDASHEAVEVFGNGGMKAQ